MKKPENSPIPSNHSDSDLYTVIDNPPAPWKSGGKDRMTFEQRLQHAESDTLPGPGGDTQPVSDPTPARRNKAAIAHYYKAKRTEVAQVEADRRATEKALKAIQKERQTLSSLVAKAKKVKTAHDVVEVDPDAAPDAALHNPAPLVKLQLLPMPEKGGFRKARTCPTRKTVLSLYSPEQRPEIVHAMADSIIEATLAIAADGALRVERPYEALQTTLTEKMMARYRGRCLWSWDDIPGDLRKMTAPMARIALRSTATFPNDLHSASPRLATNLMCTTLNGVERSIIRLLKGEDAPKNSVQKGKWSLSAALQLVTYGEDQDRRLVPMHRLPERTKRASYSAKQSLIMDVNAGGVLPFTCSVVRDTLFDIDLASRLLEIRDEVFSRLKTVGERLPDCSLRDKLTLDVEDAADREDLEKEAVARYFKACEKVLHGEWKFPLDGLEDGYPAGDADDEAMTLTCRAIIVVATGDGRKMSLTADLLFALGVLAGISPAAFIRFAIKDLERRGVTYVKSQEVEVLRSLILEWTADWTGVESKRVDALVKELMGLEKELERAEFLTELRGMYVGRWLSETGAEFVGEWFGSSEDWDDD